MKKLIPLAFIAVSILFALQARASACSLGDDDYQSIENAIRKSYTRDSLPKQGSADYKNLCLSRELLKKVRNGQDFQRTDIPSGMSRFLTLDEYNEIKDPVYTVLAGGYPTSKAS